MPGVGLLLLTGGFDWWNSGEGGIFFGVIKFWVFGAWCGWMDVYWMGTVVVDKQRLFFFFSFLFLSFLFLSFFFFWSWEAGLPVFVACWST